ncbi:flagellar biosynthetic protein FliO [Neobacillus sp. D3-1R]|uniref:flagellar biosynthetic protein FliO n=1 Tax=Neobacillus sp. D3-1R TaxID=3445778 RepID=UPI003FA04EE9
MKTWISKLFLFVFIALLGSQSVAYAEPVNNSVKDCYENPKNCEQPELAPNQDKGKDQGKQNDKSTSTVGVTFFDFVKMIFALLFVIALLYAVLKFVNKKSKSFQSTQMVENLGGTSLGSNRSVQMIKVGNRILVVGVGETIQLLKEIDDQEEYREMIEAYNQRMEQMIQPSDIVTKLLERTNKVKSSLPEDENQFATLLKKQLKDISNGRKKFMKEMEKKGTDQQ